MIEADTAPGHHPGSVQPVATPRSAAPGELAFGRRGEIGAGRKPALCRLGRGRDLHPCGGIGENWSCSAFGPAAIFGSASAGARVGRSILKIAMPMPLPHPQNCARDRGVEPPVRGKSANRFVAIRSTRLYRGDQIGQQRERWCRRREISRSGARKRVGCGHCFRDICHDCRQDDGGRR